MRVEAGGVGIEFDVTGEGRPVILLHGFPDSSRLWRHQVPVLADAGFRVIVPDLRGYGRSDQPKDVADYSMAYLAGDVLAVLDHLEVEKAHVVGHDWGAALAWALGSFVPGRVDHLVALSVGHPASFRAVRDAGPEQQARSWYMLLFQFETVAEQWLSGDDWANFRRWAGHPDTDGVIAELERSGSLTPALNWYRANVPPESYVAPPIELPAVGSPTLGVWSSGDFALTEQQMAGSAHYVTGPWRYERIEGAGHWIPLEVPDRLNELLLDFLPR
jgi:pimeloyl-ACP methyl ester carboxylesterase